MLRKTKKEPKAVVGSYVSTFLDYMHREHGCDRSEILSFASIDPRLLEQDHRYISRSQYIAISDFAMQYVEPLQFAFDMVQALEVTHHGTLGLMVMCGLNLRQAIKAILKFYRLRSKLIKLSFVEDDNNGILTLSSAYHLEAAEDASLGAALLAMYKTKSQLVGKCTGDQLFIKASQPEGLVIPDVFSDVNIQFDASAYQLVFPVEQLDLKMKSAHSPTYNTLNTQCENSLLLQDEKNTLEGELRVLLSNCDVDFPNLEQAANALHVSCRSLSRELKKTGTSYQRLLDQEKICRIKQLLKDTDLSITEIAYRLNFPDSSYLTKLFKRYVDLTPKQYRVNL